MKRGKPQKIGSQIKNLPELHDKQEFDEPKTKNIYSLNFLSFFGLFLIFLGAKILIAKFDLKGLTFHQCQETH